jgi:hypothetical protein
MDPRIVSSLISAILFLVLASPPVYSAVRSMGVKDNDMSVVVRSAMAGVLSYASLRMLL